MKIYRSHFPKKQDDRIREDVRRQLMWQADIQSEEIEVEVKNSVVSLSGRVETRLEWMEAENAAKAVYGVTSIRNNIRIEPKRPRSDGKVLDDISTRLRLMTSILEEVPSVSVQDGVVTLQGTLRWNFQKTSAERVADAVVGARQVRNLIEVIPRNECHPDVHKDARHEPRVEERRMPPQSATISGALLLHSNNGHPRAM